MISDFWKKNLSVSEKKYLFYESGISALMVSFFFFNILRNNIAKILCIGHGDTWYWYWHISALSDWN